MMTQTKHDFHLKWFQSLFSIAANTVGTARAATSSAGGPAHDYKNNDDKDDDVDYCIGG